MFFGFLLSDRALFSFSRAIPVLSLTLTGQKIVSTFKVTLEITKYYIVSKNMADITPFFMLLLKKVLLMIVIPTF